MPWLLLQEWLNTSVFQQHPYLNEELRKVVEEVWKWIKHNGTQEQLDGFVLQVVPYGGGIIVDIPLRNIQAKGTFFSTL